MDSLPNDFFVTSMQFTPSTHRDVYPAIDPTTDALSQQGKVIAITGAARGLGRRAFVASFAKASPKGIVLIARSAADLDATEEEVKAVNPTITVLKAQADLLDSEAVQKIWGQVKDKFGHVDTLVHNAGVLEGGSVAEMDPAAWWREIEINLRGGYLHIHQFLKLLPTGAPGTVINLTSGLGYQVNAGLSAHSISKLAVWHLTSFIAAENPNVLAVGLHPGVVPTDMLIPSFARFAEDTAELVGGVAVWLAAQGAKGQNNWLSGRFINSNWDVEQLLGRKEEIQRGELLKISLSGTFGKEQFDKSS